MSLGTLYGIGVGPGDPDLITVKGANLISNTKHLFAPIARIKKSSVALDIVKKFVNNETNVIELVFPMVTDESELTKRWDESAKIIADVLEKGEDAVFLTLGDALLYSTYIYLLRALRKIHPDVNVITVPGVTAFSAVAALTEFPVGEAKEPITIVPTSDDLQAVRGAVERGGTVILMKVGKRLQNILGLLEELDAMDESVFVANAGMENQRLETDLEKLKGQSDQTGYLSTILIKSRKRS